MQKLKDTVLLEKLVRQPRTQQGVCIKELEERAARIRRVPRMHVGMQVCVITKCKSYHQSWKQTSQLAFYRVIGHVNFRAMKKTLEDCIHTASLVAPSLSRQNRSLCILLARVLFHMQVYLVKPYVEVCLR